MQTLFTQLLKAIAIFVISMQLILPAQAQGINDPTRLNQPGPAEMVLDGLIVRPVMFGVTILGTVLFIVTSPFSLAGGNAGDAAEELMIKPAKMTFIRCLGCTTNERKFEVAEQKE